MEMRRVASDDVVILTFDPAPLTELWLVRDYFPRALEIHGEAMPPIEELVAWLGPGTAVEPVRADLDSGAWDERHGHLGDAPELDVGLRLVVAPAT